MTKIGSLVMATILFVSAAYAGDGESHGLPVKTFIWACFNLTLLLSVLIYNTRGKITGYLDQRAKTFNQLYAEAQASLTSARQDFEKIQDALSKLEAEKARIIEEARSEAATISENARKELEKEKQRLAAEYSAIQRADEVRFNHQLRDQVVGELMVMVKNDLMMKQAQGVHQKLSKELWTNGSAQAGRL